LGLPNYDVADGNLNDVGEGWITTIKASAPAEFDALMSKEEYEKFCEAERKK
jgi:glycine cleavage system H lipoate-binding protein